jgi:hypothetical protein
MKIQSYRLAAFRHFATIFLLITAVESSAAFEDGSELFLSLACEEPFSGSMFNDDEQTEIEATRCLDAESLEKLETSRDSHQYAPALAAAASTLMSNSFTYPLDLFKLRRQTGNTERANFYRGFASFSLASCSTVSLNLLSYEMLKKADWSPALAGSMASMITGAAGNPLWVYQVRKALHKNGPGKYDPSAYLKELRASPALGLRGQTMNFLTVLPYGGYFHLYESIYKKIRNFRGEENSSMPDYLAEGVSASTARLTISAAVYPFDTVRAIRQQTGESYPSIFQSMSKEGLGRFYKGVGFGTARVSVSTGISMCLYARFKEALGYKENKH